MATQGSGLAITNGKQQESPISLSTVEMDMGHRLTDLQAKKIEIKLKRRYVQMHGKAPPKHDQLVNCWVTLVNSYTTRDLLMVQEVIKAFIHGGDSTPNKPQTRTRMLFHRWHKTVTKHSLAVKSKRLYQSK